jgi:hypothetical protein
MTPVERARHLAERAVPRPRCPLPSVGAPPTTPSPSVPTSSGSPTRSRPLVSDLTALLAVTSDLDAATLGDLVEPDPYPLEVWRDEVVAEILTHRDALTAQEIDPPPGIAESAGPGVRRWSGVLVGTYRPAER